MILYQEVRKEFGGNVKKDMNGKQLFQVEIME